MTKKCDLSEPYKDKNGKWVVTEQLYPEVRGYIEHRFETIWGANAFIEESINSELFVFDDQNGLHAMAGEQKTSEDKKPMPIETISRRDFFAGCALIGLIQSYWDIERKGDEEIMKQWAESADIVANKMIRVLDGEKS